MNLWTEFDNARHPPDAIGHMPRSRRLTERALLASLREWLLHDYAVAYCRSLAATRIFRRCYWIDGLGVDSRAPADEDSAGRNGSERKKAASVPPALQPIVSLSQLLAQEDKPIALHGLLLGTSRQEVAAALLKEIGQAPAIFLLNPFGPALFSYEDLAPLYQRTVPTELCLLAPHKQLEMHLRAARRNTAQAAQLTGVLRTDRWKTLPDGEEELTQALDGLLDLLTTSMQRYFPLPVQRIGLPMQVRPAVVEEVPYTLIFATRRQDSVI